MNMKILILGGAKSGKSSYAVSLARGYKKVAFIATCTPNDAEMAERIRRHKASRPRHWRVFEEEINIASTLRKAKNGYDIIIIDCLALWISNMLSIGAKDKDVYNKVSTLAKTLKGRGGTVAIVSNEVGDGIVPANPLARRTRSCRRVIYATSSAPWKWSWDVRRYITDRQGILHCCFRSAFPSLMLYACACPLAL